MPCRNHRCAVQCCFSQLGMWEDERCTAVSRVKTTDLNLPRRESRSMGERSKGSHLFGWVCFVLFLAATLVPFLVLCCDYKALMFMVSCTFSYQTYSTELPSCNHILIVIRCWILTGICIYLLNRYHCDLWSWSTLAFQSTSFVLFLHFTADLLTFLLCGS